LREPGEPLTRPIAIWSVSPAGTDCLNGVGPSSPGESSLDLKREMDAWVSDSRPSGLVEADE